MFLFVDGRTGYLTNGKGTYWKRIYVIPGEYPLIRYEKVSKALIKL